MRKSYFFFALVSLAVVFAPRANAQFAPATVRCMLTQSPSVDALISDCTAAIKEPPTGFATRSVAFRHRGTAHMSKGELDRAIQDFDQAIKLEPAAGSYERRGVAYWQKGEIDRAIQDFDQALKIKPDFAIAFESRGGAYLDKVDYERAIQDLDKAIQLDPKRVFALYLRSIVKREKGDIAGADQDMKKARSIDRSAVERIEKAVGGRPN
jgi:tetratricopeptide (TPR) repeat protein